jgi:pentatricopeptide repeat protein
MECARDVVSYSVMIVGCGMHGKLNEVVGLFKEMSKARMKKMYRK